MSDSINSSAISQSLSSIVKFLGTKEGTTASCFIGGLLLLSRKEIYNNPTGSIFFNLLASSFIGGIFNMCTPNMLRPYVSSSIIGLCACSSLMRVFGFDDGRKTKDKQKPSTSTDTSNDKDGVRISIPPFIDINYSSTDREYQRSEGRSVRGSKTVAESDQLRVSYTAHKLFGNEYPRYTVQDELSIDIIMSTVNEHKNEINPQVKLSEEIIKRTIITQLGSIHGYKGVFFHNKTDGYVLISTESPNVKGDAVVSIQI